MDQLAEIATYIYGIAFQSAFIPPYTCNMFNPRKDEIVKMNLILK
jgi:hypothetical protein